MTAAALQTLAQVFTGRLLNTAAEGAVLACLVWISLRLTGRQDSATRFAIWFAVLVAIVALPFSAELNPIAGHVAAIRANRLHGEFILPISWASYLFAGWAAIAGLFLLRLGVGLWRVGKFRRNCADIDIATLDPAIAFISREPGPRRRVTICSSTDISVPAAIGFFRPAIIFPAWLLPQLSAEEFKVILLHELAHLRRWDDWTNLAQKLAKAVFFFHPAVWWIENRLTLEREMACDDMVLAQTASPKAYASSLLSFAEKLQNARALALAQALVSRMRQMSLRVAQILDSQRPRRTGPRKAAAALGAGMLAIVWLAAPYAPKVVAFRSQSMLPRQDRAQPSLPEMAASQPAAVLAAPSRVVAASWSRQITSSPQPRMIPASFHRLPPAVPVRLKAGSTRQPRILRAKVADEPFPARMTLIILRGTRYDDSGSGFWTLCIWRVGEGNSADRQLESAIVLSLI